MGSLSWQHLFSPRYNPPHELHSAAAVHPVTSTLVPPEPAGRLCVLRPVGGARVPRERGTVTPSGLVQR